MLASGDVSATNPNEDLLSAAGNCEMHSHLDWFASFSSFHFSLPDMQTTKDVTVRQQKCVTCIFHLLS